MLRSSALLLALVPTLLGAQLRVHAQSRAVPAAETLRVIPLPREVVSVGAPVRLAGPVHVDAGSDAGLRAAGGEFVAALRERGVEATDGGGRGYAVRLLRAASRAGREFLDEHRLAFDSTMREEGYVLVADGRGAHVVATSDAGAFYGLQTLAQLITGAGEGAQLRPATVRDWPAMRWRGVHDDLSRGPMPTLEYQKRQVRTFAAYKINVYSPYFEHTLAFRSHPLIAPPGGAMTRDEVRELVAYARRFHVTVVPEQQTFGHLHHALKLELYEPLAETPHGHVLAPGVPASLDLTRAIYAEIDSLFPSPFLHLGADETFELGKGRTKALVDSQGIGAVYVRYLKDIERAVRGVVRGDRRFLFWGDIAMHHPDLVKELPAGMVAVGWEYAASRGFDRFLKPFRDAGMETWVAPGVSNWNRVWPNFAVALPNIQGFAREGQAAGATGLLNTSWDDFGDAIFEQAWRGIAFGAAAAWQPGESDIARFDRDFGLQFHGDTTGMIDAAHRHLDAAHVALQGTRAGDASSYLFFLDPFTDEGVVDLVRLRPVLSQVRIHAESALVLVARAREQAHLRERGALDAMELGARRIDWIGAKFQLADEVAQSLAATIDPARTARVTWVDLADLSGINGKLQSLRDGYTLTRELYERAWLAENRPYWMQNILAKYDAEIIRWVERINAMDRIRRRHAREGVLPRAAELGIPEALLRR
jgi:hexosaminidase